MVVTWRNHQTNFVALGVCSLLSSVDMIPSLQYRDKILHNKCSKLWLFYMRFNAGCVSVVLVCG